ncbi:hypothetical protein N9R79_00910 [Vibrio sp.]|nr:hypothetical protein [Vibrio sp.]
MRKTDKKIDNALRISLTTLCDRAQDEFIGFEWITHLVDYSSFPKSLMIVCVFDTEQHLLQADTLLLTKWINKALVEAKVNVKDINKHVTFDTEESCHLMNQGQWSERFKRITRLR